MHVHLIFVTKYRREVFTKAILDDMRTIFESICRDVEAELIEFNGEDDHVHLLVNYPPKVISTLLNSLKGVSSRMLRKKNDPSIRKNYGAMPSARLPASRTAAPSVLSITALKDRAFYATR